MSQIIQVKKNTVYLPKEIVEELKIMEKIIFLVEIKGNYLVSLLIRKPSGLKEARSEIEPEEVEKVGEEINRQIFE